MGRCTLGSCISDGKQLGGAGGLWRSLVEVPEDASREGQGGYGRGRRFAGEFRSQGPEGLGGEIGHGRRRGDRCQHLKREIPQPVVVVAGRDSTPPMQDAGWGDIEEVEGGVAKRMSQHGASAVSWYW